MRSFPLSHTAPFGAARSRSTVSRPPRGWNFISARDDDEERAFAKAHSQAELGPDVFRLPRGKSWRRRQRRTITVRGNGSFLLDQSFHLNGRQCNGGLAL